MKNIKRFINKKKLLAALLLISVTAAVNFFAPSIFKSYAALDPGHPWSEIEGFPADCGAGQYVSAIDTGTCSAPPALSADGSNCAAGNYAKGVDASGNAQGCSVVGWNEVGSKPGFDCGVGVAMRSLNLATSAVDCITVPTGGVTGSGSANYLTKWTGGTSLGNSMISDDGSSIRVDTTWGTAKFNVYTAGYAIVGDGSGAGGTGVYGRGDASGVLGATVSGNAVVGLASGAGNGVWGSSGGAGSGVYGSGVYGVYGIGSNTGVFGQSGASVGVYGNGPTFGVYGNSANVGVHGVGSNAGVDGYGSNYGVFAQGGTTGVRAAGTSYDFYAEGAGTDYGAASSIRWKENIVPIDNALDKVLKLRGVYYDWKKDRGGKHGMGMIAEEVGQVVPEIVSYEENGIDATGMDYGHLTPILVEAIKEQQKQIEELKNEIKSLKTEINNR